MRTGKYARYRNYGAGGVSGAVLWFSKISKLLII
jgi:hypothetical protein